MASTTIYRLLSAPCRPQPPLLPSRHPIPPSITSPSNILIRIKHPITPLLPLIRNPLPRPRRPTRTLRLLLHIPHRRSPRVLLSANIAVETSILAGIVVEAAFGYVFPVGLAALGGLGDHAGDVAGGGVDGGFGGVIGGGVVGGG